MQKNNKKAEKERKKYLEELENKKDADIYDLRIENSVTVSIQDNSVVKIKS